MDLLKKFERDGFVKIDHWDGLPYIHHEEVAEGEEGLTEFGKQVTYKVMQYNPWSQKFEYLPKRVRITQQQLQH